MIDKKAEINAALWDTNETPLNVAAFEGNTDCFKVL